MNFSTIIHEKRVRKSERIYAICNSATWVYCFAGMHVESDYATCILAIWVYCFGVLQWQHPRHGSKHSPRMNRKSTPIPEKTTDNTTRSCCVTKCLPSLNIVWCSFQHHCTICASLHRQSNLRKPNSKIHVFAYLLVYSITKGLQLKIVHTHYDKY